MKSAQRLRITETGWNGYTGFLGVIEFKDGISVDPVLPLFANQIGALVRVEAIDDDAQVGAGVKLLDGQTVEAPVVPEMERSDTPVTPPTPVEPAAPAHTREQLEAIADQHGIHGLREIAEKFGVKGRGIKELIEEILAAQGK